MKARAWAPVVGGALLLATPGRAQDAGGDAATADGADATVSQCLDSGDCARPTPYCHPTLARCVACLTDTNCITSTGVCAEDVGECVLCASDDHCFGATPYCDQANDRCVQCLTHANCGPEGIQCVDGLCGSCGDGFCGPGEAIVGDPFSGEFSVCLEDCLSACPVADLGDALAAAVAVGTLAGAESRMVSPSCGGSGPDTTFGWSAPTSGTFVIDTFGSAFDTLAYVIAGDDCSAVPLACSDDAAGQTTSQVVIDASAGDRFVIVVDSWGFATDFTLNIHELSGYDGGGAACNPASCERPDGGGPPCCTSWGECGTQLEWSCDLPSVGPPPFEPGGGADGGPIDPVLRDRCLTNALSGTESLCAEVAQCTCEHCAQQTEDCRVIPGCLDLLACMTTNACDGLECNVPELCQSEIDASGGVNGPGFRGASALQTCAGRASCSLHCPESSSEAGAGTLCTPQREEVCACSDGASGVRICKDDGSGFGACVCVEPPADEPDAGTQSAAAAGDDDGCGCRIARTAGRSHGTSSLLGLVLALAGMRRIWTRRSREIARTGR